MQPSVPPETQTAGVEDAAQGAQEGSTAQLQQAMATSAMKRVPPPAEAAAQQHEQEHTGPVTVSATAPADTPVTQPPAAPAADAVQPVVPSVPAAEQSSVPPAVQQGSLTFEAAVERVEGALRRLALEFDKEGFFQHKVSTDLRGCEDYYERIKNPMWFAHIREKVSLLSHPLRLYGSCCSEFSQRYCDRGCGGDALFEVLQELCMGICWPNSPLSCSCGPESTAHSTSSRRTWSSSAATP